MKTKKLDAVLIKINKQGCEYDRVYFKFSSLEIAKDICKNEFLVENEGHSWYLKFKRGVSYCIVPFFDCDVITVEFQKQ